MLYTYKHLMKECSRISYCSYDISEASTILLLDKMNSNEMIEAVKKDIITTRILDLNELKLTLGCYNMRTHKLYLNYRLMGIVGIHEINTSQIIDFFKNNIKDSIPIALKSIQFRGFDFKSKLNFAINDFTEKKVEEVQCDFFFKYDRLLYCD